MLYIDRKTSEILKHRLKIGDRRVNIRVEVDKLVYDPSITTEMDYVVYRTDGSTPEIVGGTLPNASSSSIMISPIKGVSIPQLVVTSEFQVISVNGKQRTHPLTGEKKDHNGVDLNASQGTEIVAVADGVVTEINTKEPSYINILHANGILTRYVHMGDYTVKIGDKVVQNQVICKVAPKDSYSTGPHLHFEVRINASKTSWGDPRDPMTYLKGGEQIYTTSSMSMSPTPGIISVDNVRFREQPRVDAPEISRLNIGDNVTVLGTEANGEYYKIQYNGKTGYAYSRCIEISSEEAPTTGGNPSYQEAVNYIIQQCNAIGLPARIGLAIAWTESGMRQFKNDGTPVKGDNGTSADWGMMQLNDSSWSDTYDFNRIKTDWKYNVRAGLDIALNRYNEAVRRNEGQYAPSLGISVEDTLARATYSGYNTWSNIDRYRTENDQRDTNFYNYYKTQPWLSKTGVATTPINSGTVKTNTVVRAEPNLDTDEVVSQVPKGMVLSTNGLEGDWYTVTLPDGKTGYIPASDFDPNAQFLNLDYKTSRIFKDDFEKYTLYSVPTKSIYTQDSAKLWKIQNDGASNVLAIKGGGIGTNYIQFTVNIHQSGKVTFKYKSKLSDGNKFNVYDNEALIISKSGTVDKYSTVSLSLLPGTHVIKLERLKAVNGDDLIVVDDVTVDEFFYKYLDQDGLVNVDISSIALSSLTVTADGVNVYSTQNTSSTILYNIERGTVLNCIKVDSQWVKVIFTDGTEGYIHNYTNTCEITNNNLQRNNLEVHMGGFVYEKTLELKNLESVNIDYRYDMRAASAIIVVSNPGGYLSPDYNPISFPVRGMKKSKFSDYYEDEIIGVLRENTPIRIYMGYGDNPPRKFTGLIDSVDIDGDKQTITIKCTDMMKKLNNYVSYKDEMFPPDGVSNVAWLVSSVIHEMADRAGMSGWRKVYEDLKYPDIIVEETYYIDYKPEDNIATLMDENGNPYAVKISSLSDENGYLNPYIYISKEVKKGTAYADEIDNMCQNIGFWQRCDYFGTYKCTSVKYDPLPVAYFKDSDNIITLNKTIDYSRTRNHIIVTGAGQEEHFFNSELWRAVNGERKTMQVNAPWADTYGKKRAIAVKAFNDMLMNATTVNVCIEGNPYLELLDTVGVEHANMTTRDTFVIKAIKDSWNVNQGYMTFLDLFLLKEGV